MTATVVQTTVVQTTGIMRRPYALTTVGTWSLSFLAAFEALAVTTIMPIVTADLDGRALYSLTFSATLAAGIVGMVVAGSWADSRGPAVPLLTAIVLFGAGLAIAGTASSMVVFVAGRFLQGLGAGGITVALYVLIAKVYPAGLHIKIFSAFAAAWVLPSMVGPFVAGVVTDVFSWHWVFLGVVVLVAASTAMLVPAVRRIEHEPPRGPAFDARRVAAAVVVALAVVVVSSSTEWDPRIAWITAPVMIVVIAFAARPLLPAGTYCVRSGLPSVVVLSAAAGAVFFGTEVYLPLLLHDRYGLPAWLSGVTLTAAAVSWALASAVQGRLGERLSAAVALRWGASLLVVGVVTQLVTAAGGLSPVVAAAGWFVAGAGMGTMYPRISTLILAHSEPGQEGFNTAAKSISESIGGSVSLALTGLIFALLGDAATRTPYVGVLVFTSVIAVAGVLLAGRAGVRSAR